VVLRLAKRRSKKAPPDDTLRARAEKSVIRRTGFLWLLYSVGSYVVVNALLIAIWVISDSDHPWFLWVLAVWGLGLAFHIAGYVIGFRFGYSRERMIEGQMEEYRKRYEEMEAPVPEAAPPESGIGGETLE
jgi:2TM domain